MIRHTVAFSLRYPDGSAEEAAFLGAALVLPTIPGVERFERLRQLNPTNHYRFGFSMEFTDQAAYDAYNVHPAHVAFVATHWVTGVSDYLEADFSPL